MLPVSATWQAAIKEQFRYQGYLRVSFQVSPPGLQDNLSISSDDSFPQSDIDSMNDSNYNPVAYASLEPNRWLLNGTFNILPDGATQTGDWWSTIFEDASKVIHFQFDNTYNIPGVYIQWDSADQTFPTKIKVTGYDTDGGVISTKTISDIDSYITFVDIAMDKVFSVDLEITEWNNKDWRAHIAEVLFGLYASYDSINNGRVVSADSVMKASPLSEDLPTVTISLSLRNLDREFDPSLESGVSKYLAQRQRVEFQWGFATSYNNIEWAPSVYKYIESFSIPEDSKEVTVETTHRLAFMETDFKKAVYDGTRRTLYSVADEVLRNSDIIKESENDQPWELDEILKSFYTDAPVPKQPTNQVLQLIANASTCWLSSDPTNDYVKISRMSVDEDSAVEVGTMQQLGDPAFEIQEQLHTLTIGVYKYIAADTKTNISSGEYSITGQTTLQMDYTVDSARGVTCSVSGATLVSFTPYSSSAIVVVKPSSGSSATATVTLEGYEVKSSTTYVQTYQDTSLTAGLDVIIDNPFITETESLSALSDWIVGWYNRRQKMSMSYIGYPELEPGDTVNLSTIYKNNVKTQVLSNELSFNGAFDGTLEVQ